MPLDINSRIRPMRSISPAAHTISRNGAGVPLGATNSLGVVIAVGAVTTINDTDKVTFTVKMGPDTDIANATDIDANAYMGVRQQSGAVWDRILDASNADADVCLQFGVENKRNDAYAFVVATSAGSPSLIVGAAIILGDLPVSPNPAP